MKKKLHIIVLAAVSIMMLAGIHITQEFRFYNIESNTLFLYDWSDIWAKRNTASTTNMAMPQPASRWLTAQMPMASIISATDVAISS